MATWRIDMPCSRIDTYDAIASRGGGSSPFFLRPTKEGYMYMSKRLALVLAGAVMAALMVAMTGVASAQDVAGCKGDIVLDPGHGGTDPGAVNNTYGLTEKAETLKVALDLKDLLTITDGYKVCMTRTTND